MFLSSNKKNHFKIILGILSPIILAFFVFIILLFSPAKSVMATIIGCPATGGTVTQVGSYCINTFTSSDTFTVPSGNSITADVLVVGGGGGGGSATGGGGGAGGYRYVPSFFIPASGSGYTVTVGEGGAGGINGGPIATNGGDSVFYTITATGGGAGGDPGSGSGASYTGGSGGGGSWVSYAGANGNTPSTSPSQGNNGGAGRSGGGYGDGYNSGGGGGSSSVGEDATSSQAGNGGNGKINPISGSTAGQLISGFYYFAGGGGGGADEYRYTNGGNGGSGGGGNGGTTSAGSDGMANTGGGGGGGSNASTPGGVDFLLGGAGGSGIVIVRYLNTNVSGITSGYAWAPNSGWVNFGCSNCNAEVTNTGMTGYAWSDNYGWISLSCSNNGGSCSPRWGVTNNLNGTLGGYAWSANAGWIDFNGASIVGGQFTGETVSDSLNGSLGQINFDCTSTGCPVTTTWTPPGITFNISNNSIGFGLFSSSAPRYATSDSDGSSSDTSDAATISVSSNDPYGYVVTVAGSTLTNTTDSSVTIPAIGATPEASAPGTEQFGMRVLNDNDGTGLVSAPYNTSDWALDSANFPSEIASGSGDGSTTIFGIRYLCNISTTTRAGSYSANLIFSATPNF